MNETLFNIKWKQWIELFSCVNNYLMGTLDKIKESWSNAFICIINMLTFYFTAGMTSTQCVECINEIIKKYVNSKSSWVEYFNDIPEFFYNQTAKAKYQDWIESLLHINVSTTSAKKIFHI
ncbi:protein FAR1-related sequence 5-like [Rhizophagus clarus]|uniref:Protein FAR1-related sequence 5-like n=1 Tax=Rhizophagus clarus TaxID=94130 RepID=A0A8H3LH38_9GLOM|nr:protein FAR1-related sequence 5-like [Rhizophagus clarus]